MNLKTLGSSLAAAVLLSACSGGGGSSSTPLHPQAAAKSRGTVTFTYSRSAANRIRAASNFRNAKYVSPGTLNAQIFIDGVDASGHVACNVAGSFAATPVPIPAPSSTAPAAVGATGTCTVSWASPAGVTIDGSIHNFTAEIDDGANVLAEGLAANVPVALGENAPLTITLNGVVGSASITDPAPQPKSGTVTIAIGDADSYAIVPSIDPDEAFDNPPVVTISNSYTTHYGASLSTKGGRRGIMV